MGVHHLGMLLQEYKRTKTVLLKFENCQTLLSAALENWIRPGIS